MAEIRLAGGQVTIVDDADYRWLRWFKWMRQTSRSGNDYAVCCQMGGTTRMHRAIIDAPNGMVVDHINGDSLDNRRSNLRLATSQENNRNAKKAAGKMRVMSSQYKGVSRVKDGLRSKKWRAMLAIDRKRIHLGHFNTEEEAARAYDAAAKEHFGEFARLNF